MSIKPFLKAFLLTIIVILLHTSCRQPDGNNEKFLLYKQQLSEFREEFSVRDMPEVRFFIFGMGNRPKLLYKDGLLMNAATGEVLRKWEVKEDLIIPNEYRVDMLNRSSGKTEIYENETGVYIRENGIASQAYYEGMSRIDTIYTRLKTCVPHTWHAAEIFLYLSDQ